MNPIHPKQNEPGEATLAHVLFIDIVGSSKSTTDEQTGVVKRLKEIVTPTAEYRRARSADQLISLPTGDGMALAFFSRLVAAVACAVEVAEALKRDPFCKVRMGVNSGLVIVTADINDQPNIAGAGINRAERVMSCGDADHILLSDNVGDAMLQLSKWKNMVHQVGECTTKDGSLRLWSLHDSSIGNAALPAKAKRPLLPVGRRAALVVGVVALGYAAWLLLSRTMPHPEGSAGSPSPINNSAPANAFHVEVLRWYARGDPAQGDFYVRLEDVLYAVDLMVPLKIVNLQNVPVMIDRLGFEVESADGT